MDRSPGRVTSCSTERQASRARRGIAPTLREQQQRPEQQQQQQQQQQPAKPASKSARPRRKPALKVGRGVVTAAATSDVESMLKVNAAPGSDDPVLSRFAGNNAVSHAVLAELLPSCTDPVADEEEEFPPPTPPPFPFPLRLPA